MIIRKFTDHDMLSAVNDCIHRYKIKKHDFDIITDKGKTKHYLNIPIAFDTETTSFRNRRFCIHGNSALMIYVYMVDMLTRSLYLYRY